MEIIHFYGEKNAYGEFSNFYPSPITIDGVRYPTVEHYYQAQKFLGPDATPRSIEYAQLITNQSTPNKAKVLAGQKVKGGYKWVLELNDAIRNYSDVHIRSDWEDVKDNVMRKGVFNKFSQNQNLLKALLLTGDKMLAEHTSRDKYWGDGGDGTGLNMLGRILVETRILLKRQTIRITSENYWIIYNVLLTGDIDVNTLNKVHANFLLDLSGQQIVNNKVFGQDLPNQIYIWNQHMLVHSIGANYEELSCLLIQAIGKKYVCYVYDIKEEFLTLIFNKLYGF